MIAKKLLPEALEQVGWWSGTVVSDRDGNGSAQPGSAGHLSPPERLLQILETHVRSEAEGLAAYRQLAETADDPVIRLLMRLVLEDEERHHRLMERMATTLRDALYWTTSADALPTSTLSEQAPTVEAAAIRTFIREEQAAARRLRDLAREDARAVDGVYSLLLEIMAMDSDKHARILQFILRRVESKA